MKGFLLIDPDKNTLIIAPEEFKLLSLKENAYLRIKKHPTKKDLNDYISAYLKGETDE